MRTDCPKCGFHNDPPSLCDTTITCEQCMSVFYSGDDSAIRTVLRGPAPPTDNVFKKAAGWHYHMYAPSIRTGGTCQEDVNDLAKDGWELFLIDSFRGWYVFRKPA